VFWIVLLFFLFSITFPVGRLAMQISEPIFFTGIRMLVAGVLLVTYYYFKHPLKFKEFFKFKYLHTWIILAIFNIFFTNVLEFWGLKTLTAAKACFIYSFSPFFAAMFSYFFFGERMTPKKVIGLSVGLLGFLPILLTGSSAESKLGGIGFLSWAELALIGAAFSTALGWVIMRHSIRKTAYPGMLSNGISMIIAGIVMLPLSLIFENWNPVPVTNYSKFLFYMIILIITSNIMAYNLYADLLKKYTATFLSLAGLMQPLFAALIGWIVLNEGVGWPFFVSAVAVFIGLSILYKEELAQGYIS